MAGSRCADHTAATSSASTQTARPVIHQRLRSTASRHPSAARPSAGPCREAIGEPSAAAQPPTLTWAERHFGYGIARAYAGHTDTTGAATTTYIKADLQAVATALAAMTGQHHPLARTTGPDGLYCGALT